jgi:aspartate aminotransferase-like enzyme
MNQVDGLRVKVATDEWEFRAIHRLNHLTFAEEIPQHDQQPSGLLVDRFHGDNTYLVAVRGDRLVGMLAVRAQRPFSLEQKLPDFDSYLPAGRRVCEIRLLAIAKADRSGRVLQHLFRSLWRYSREHGFDLAVISGTTRQLNLYQRAGFIPFGPLVGKADALFQPMYITREQAAALFCRWARGRSRLRMTAPVNLLPGPSNVRRKAAERLTERAESHRCASFAADFARTQALLCAAAGAARAEILLGSGTLANDSIAAQLSTVRGAGMILTNGEFGDRLVDHAARFGLAYEVMRWSWGAPFDLAAVERRLSAPEAPAWVWFVHLETSTGVLNDLDALSRLSARCGTRLCVDAVSSFGLVPVNLCQASFASAVSGKGLRSAVGLAIVFHRDDLAASTNLPRYLDLGLAVRHGGVPFTHSSPLVRALSASIAGLNWRRRCSTIHARSAWLRAELAARGFDIVAAASDAAPGIITIALPEDIESLALADELADDGFLLSAHSGYLRQRNWIQVSLMSQPPGWRLRALVRALSRRCVNVRRPRRPPA